MADGIAAMAVTGAGFGTLARAGMLDLLAFGFVFAAGWTAFSLLDPSPGADRWLRLSRRAVASLILTCGLLAASALGTMAHPGAALPPLWQADALLLLLATSAVAAFSLDRRHGRLWLYAAISLPWALGYAVAHAWRLQIALPEALATAGLAAWLPALLLSIAAAAMAFVLCTLFRRRRPGTPAPLALAGSGLLGGGVWTLNTGLALAPGPATLQRPQDGWLFAFGILLLIAGVFVAARRQRDRQASQQSLREGSRTDPACGLPTLDVIAESFVRVLRLAVAGHGAVAVAVLHFAGLDRVQSTQGRRERDRLFALAAWRLRSVRRDEELLGSMGDNRLLVVLRLADQQQASQRVRDLVKLFEAPLGDGDGKFRLRPSAGVSLWPTHGDDFSRLLANALVALERCPPGGMQLFHATQREENEQRLRVETTLSSAIAQGELSLVMQPIIDALSGEVRMVELLARWNSSELGNVEPRQFILIAESSGVIGEFDRWLLREAISTTKWLDAAGFIDLRVALNCSPVNLTDEAFLDFFERTIRESAINPARIEVEVTEAALAEGEQQVVASLLRLRDLGVGITIDDFGIGHSSLARLRDLPVDSLKIDQSFVRDMDHPKGEFLVSGILGLAHGLGKAVIAEGVENEAQRAALTELGCEYLQGFQISKPLSWRALLDFLGAGEDQDTEQARDSAQH